MPFLELQTNQTLSRSDQNSFLDTAVTVIAQQLDKPEQFFMSVAHTGLNLRMAGSDEPAACVDLAGLGLTSEYTDALTASLTELTVARLGIAPGRVFVRFQNYERSMWGCNGQTFA